MTRREPIPVQGVNDLGFFRPFLDLDSELWSWYEIHNRQIPGLSQCSYVVNTLTLQQST